MPRVSLGRALAEVCKDIGQVFFAAVFISPLMDGLESVAVALGGLILALISWFAYMYFINK